MRNTSGGQKQHKKRKHRPTTPPVKSRIAQRLEKIRTGRTYLWDDDSDEDTLDEQPRKKSSRTAHVTFLDSDDERPSTPPHQPLRKTPTSKKKTSHQQNEADTCLICSILSQLSSYNCCSAHLSLLKAATPHRHHAVRSRGSSEKVIVARMSEDDIQQYLEPTPRKTPKSSKPRSSRAAIPPLASTIVVGTSISPDVNNATVTSTSSPTKMTTSSDVEPKRSARKTSDDCQVEHPWIDISEETDAALEHVLSQVELAAESPLEYTPTAARRTNTEVMAARLPKIPLKQGRFRNGKPIGKSPTDVTSANEYRPRVDAQTSPPPPATASSPPENIPEPSEREAGFRLIVPNAADMAADNNENAVVDLNANLSDDVQQSSSVTMKDKATPSRQSTILTPDGSRVRISRPALIHNRRSPSIGVLRRTSTDVTPVAPNAEP